MKIRTWMSGMFLLAATAAQTGAGTPDAPAMRFVDVTAGSGIVFEETIGDHKMSNIVESAGVGCAFLDFDGDGWLDVYLVSGCWMEGLSDEEIEPEERERLAAITDRLLRNRGDGTFEDVTRSSGVGRRAYGMGVIAADYDSDGDPDLYVTNYGPNFLYHNNGDGTFTDVAAEAGVQAPEFSAGAVFLDYDLDGRLDLFVGGYVDYDTEYGYYYSPDGFPGPLAYAGVQDRLFRGNPDGTFTDVTREAGVIVDPVGRAMGVGVFDFDGDRFPDIFVSNDAMENFLLHNQGDGTFTNAAWDAGVAFGEAGEATAAMAVEFGDFDNDGRIDVFVPDLDFTCLYRASEGGLFEERSAVSGIGAVCGQYASWGGVFGDFDLDSRLDLYISNGDVHHLEAHEDLLFRGEGDGRFTDVSEEAGAWARVKFVSRGAVGGDFDNDGDLDVLVNNLNDRPVLLRNDTPRSDRHWLQVLLRGRNPNPDALGSVVRVHAGGGTQIRHRTSGGSYLSQHDPRLHFGLGTAETVDAIEVIWPDGTRQTLNEVEADRVIVIRQQLRPEE